MRRSVLFFGVGIVLALTYLLYTFSTLLSLLLEDFANDAIPRTDIPSLNGTSNSSPTDSRPQLIPKIIHQTYKNETIPEVWKDAQKSCINLHDDYEYILWTDAKAIDFIAREYPWFLETFKGYKYPIQRADTIRYFVLAHFGGIYIDLDDGCNRRLDPLLSYPAWLRQTSPTGISNDAMGSAPGHPFFLRVIDSLQTFNRNCLLPYITVMYSTGPLFLSVIWKQYTRASPPNIDERERVRILMKDEYNRHPWSFFTYHKGSSWHGKDAQLIFWMGQNWIMLTVLGTVLCLLVGFTLYKCYSRILAINSLPSPFRWLSSKARAAAGAAAAGVTKRGGGAKYTLLTPADGNDEDALKHADAITTANSSDSHRRRRSSAPPPHHAHPYDTNEKTSVIDFGSYALATPNINITEHSSSGPNGATTTSTSSAGDTSTAQSAFHPAPTSAAATAYLPPPTRSPLDRSHSSTSFTSWRLGVPSSIVRALSRDRNRSPSPLRPSSSRLADTAAACGLTGDDIEAQSVLTQHPPTRSTSSMALGRGVDDARAREAWAQKHARRESKELEFMRRER